MFNILRMKKNENFSQLEKIDQVCLDIRFMNDFTITWYAPKPIDGTNYKEVFGGVLKDFINPNLEFIGVDGTEECCIYRKSQIQYVRTYIRSV